MCKFIAFSVTLCSVLFALTDCTSSFDQRQTGDLNVQIDLKNIQLIALLKGGNEEYVDYDYAYDYSEMTIKPQNGTTPRPLNTTTTQTQSNVTSSSIVLAENVTESSINATELNGNATEQIIITTESSVNFTTEPAEITSNQTANISANYSAQTNTTKGAQEDTTTTTKSPAPPNITSVMSTMFAAMCEKGYVKNARGRCVQKSILDTLKQLRRAIKHAQKINIGRSYKGT